MIYFFYLIGGWFLAAGAVFVLVGFTGNIRINGIKATGQVLNNYRLKFGLLGVALLFIGFYIIHL